MLTPIVLGVGVAAVGVLAKYGFSILRGGSAAGSKYSKGGFDPKMNKREAALILALNERNLTRTKIKASHRKIMISNHPDRGGSPYIASKVNEAKAYLDKTPGIRPYSSFSLNKHI